MKIRIEKKKLSELVPTESNPRQIKKDDFERLKKSVKSFPKMLDIREIVIDENGTILGGHQRVKALLANGETEATVKIVEGLSDDEKREFVIRDNIQNGEWDFDILANEWDDLPLGDWGIELGTNDNENDIERNDIDADFDVLKIEIECANESEQEELFAEFQSRGLKCRVI